MRPDWDPRGRRHGVKRAWRRFAGLMAVLLLASIAVTSFLGFRSYGCATGSIGASPGSVMIFVPPIPDGERVSLKKAVRSASFPVLLPPTGWPLVEVWISKDRETVALGLKPRKGDETDETIYIKEFDRPRAERDEYLDRALRSLPEAFETEVGGLRAIAQPVCSEQAHRRVGPRLRTGTLYLYGGEEMSELKEIAETMLRHPPPLVGGMNPRPSVERARDRAARADAFHH